jgi:N-acyl-L-homoserine lactone synthetase
MVDIVTAANRRQYRKHLDSMFEDRKRVFVDIMRWDIPVAVGKFEIDQFDDDKAIYLVISNSAGGHMGSLRLLSTDHPHMLGNLFPYLCENGVPSDSNTMEITRLCLSPRLPASERLRIRNRLISVMVDYGRVRGIKTFTGVVTAHFLSKIMTMGWRCDSLGPLRAANGTMIGAFCIHVDEAPISASLITGLNSDLPSEVTAQVTENVYDTVTGQILLIPQGAKLIGSYDSVVAFGQSRALLVWQRIIMPDGSSIQIDNLPATDAAGYAGLSDKVDYHTWTLLKGIRPSTLLGVGTETTFGSSQSNLVQAIEQSTEESTNQAGQRIVEKDLNIQPTITVRLGWPLRVIVSKDLTGCGDLSFVLADNVIRSRWHDVVWDAWC